jgi:hypothetical protein
MPPTHDNKPKAPDSSQKVTSSPQSAPQAMQGGTAHLIQRALQDAQALTPRDVQVLQRTIGNRAVGALIQRVSGAARKKIAKMENITVDEVQRWQTAGALSDKDLDKVLMLDEEKFSKALSLSAASFQGAATFKDGIDEMLEQAKVKARNTSMQEAAATAPTGPIKPPILIKLNDLGIDDSDARPFIARVGAGPINLWLATNPAELIVRRMIIAANKSSKTLDEMNAVLVTANIHNYAIGELLDLLITYSYSLVLAALNDTAAENRLRYVQLWLGYGVSGASPIQLQRLVRFQARLRDGANPVFTVYQNDRNYAGSADPPSRTGFLRYNFTGDMMEVHTHWNVTKKQIVSMHVQDNSANGLEINTWTWFADVAARIVAGHNAATGARVPTTTPTGGSLT